METAAVVEWDPWRCSLITDGFGKLPVYPPLNDDPQGTPYCVQTEGAVPIQTTRALSITKLATVTAWRQEYRK